MNYNRHGLVWFFSRSFVIFLVFGIVHSTSVNAQQEVGKQIKKASEEATGLKQLESKSNLSFTVTTQRGDILQKAEVLLKGKNHVSVRMQNGQADTYLVRNGDSYFVNGPEGIVYIRQPELMSQIDSYLLLTNLYDIIDWSKDNLVVSEERAGNEKFTLVSQGNTRLWLEKGSKRPVKWITTVEEGGSEITRETQVKEYKTVKGIQMPVFLETRFITDQGEFLSTQTISDMVFERSLSKDPFKAEKTR